MLSLIERLSTSLPLGPGDDRIETSSWVAFLRSGGHHPEQTIVRPLDFGNDVCSRVQTIRQALSCRGRRCATWEIGPSVRPANLEQQLLAVGLKPYHDPLSAGMLLLSRPRDASTLIQTRRAETVADYVEAFEIMNAVFAERTESATERLERAQRTWELDLSGRGALFLAISDGQAVSAARSVYLPEAVALFGGCTLPHARSQGAYRSLVAARFTDAIRRETPTLVVHAGPLSRPILEQLGFETVVEISILLDEWGDGHA